MAVKELLTIKEFSELAGKTPQAIYKQLNGRLKPFVQLVDNKKMLESRALGEVFGIEAEETIEQSGQPELNIQANLEKTLYDILKAELEAKNEQIASLQAELAEERRHSREQADKIAVFADQAQKLQLAQMQPRITEEEDELLEQEIMPEKKGIFELFRHWFEKDKEN